MYVFRIKINNVNRKKKKDGAECNIAITYYEVSGTMDGLYALCMWVSLLYISKLKYVWRKIPDGMDEDLESQNWQSGWKENLWTS